MKSKPPVSNKYGHSHKLIRKTSAAPTKQTISRSEQTHFDGELSNKHSTFMQINLYRPSHDLATRELLFLGFTGDFDMNILGFPYESEEYNYEIINNPLKAFHWLEGKLKENQSAPPFALLCKLQWLKNDDFRLVNQLREHPELRFIPIIALSERGDVVNIPALIQNGVDDCYSVPVDWDMLEDRLEFLNQFKPKLQEQARQVNQEAFRYKIPLAKRLFDIVGASIGILLTSPLWIPVATAIYFESGWPLIYSSKRAGFGYHVFNFLKFRSMLKDADKRLKELEHLNQYKKTEKAVFVKYSNDPRITRVGRFIRKYSIDELPQLINILKGDMSLVGNRPLPLYEAEMLTKDEWSARFLGPAGLTGLWQVTKRGKNDMSVEERVALDIEYAKNYSIWTDIKIILKTFTAFIQKENV